MTFDSFISAQSFFLWAIFVVALVMGAVVNKTNFCTMGAVSDWVNIGDTGRFRAWLFAIAIALLGVTLLEARGLVDVSGAFPPYRGSQFIWAENLLGGFLFGIGMTLASGCAPSIATTPTSQSSTTSFIRRSCAHCCRSSRARAFTAAR